MKNLKTLNTLIEQAGEYHPLYGGGLATHIPMVMIALNQLGASDSKLTETFTRGTKQLESIGSLANVIAVDNIEQCLGNSSKFESYLKYFKNELSLYGTQAVLKKSLPRLITGIAASAFHALIRLAYAIEVNNKNEIAIALAYWCIEFQSFELSIKTTDESLAEILNRLAPLGENYNFSPGIIVEKMAEVGELLKAEQHIIQPSTIDLTIIRQLALKVFYRNSNFTLLHTVTGCHAFSIIMPYLENVELALNELWKAILVAYLSTGTAYSKAEITLPKNTIDFAPIIASALTARDFHVIKLVYSCVSEYKKHQEPLYYLIAQRAVATSN